MNRRAFMVSAGAIASAAAFGRFSWTHPLGIRKALKLGMIEPGATLAEKFAIARAAGFAGVELDSPGSLRTDEVIKAKRETGIVVPGVVNSVHWSKPLNHPDEAVREEGIAGLERAVRDANAWCDRDGGERPTVLLVPAVVRADMPYADARRLSIEGIARVLPLARELGVTIAIENVWNEFLLSPIEAAAYVDELNELTGERAVGWYFDVGNVWRLGWPAHWIDALGDRIVRLDIKAYSRARADERGKWAGFGVEIGDGDLDWAAVRAALGRIGYAGWATAEVAGGDGARLAAIGQRMDAVLGLNGAGSGGDE